MATSLTEDHKMRRKSFAQYCRRELIDYAGCRGRMFSLSGSLNKQNCRIWGSERLNEMYETFQDSPSGMV